MKTNKEWRHRHKFIRDCLYEQTGQSEHGEILDLLDDITTLESALEEAKRQRDKWIHLSDPEGGAPTEDVIESCNKKIDAILNQAPPQQGE